ncbi:MAG: YfhO family protein [Acidobacteria bacterium]|nr:YfhO family protein [Acidobacteriota bacterium]
MSDQKQSFPWMPAGFLLGLSVLFYWKILFTNEAMFPWDAADYFYPTFGFVQEQLRHLRIPFWDPYVLSGYPIIGDIQAEIFYPPNWLLVLLSPFSSLPYRLVELQEILHLAMAGLFLYLLAREYVESETAALLGGVLFTFSGAMVARTQHVNAIDAMAWSPLIFLLARRGLLRKDLRYSAAAGICFGVQLLAGRWQHSVYLGLLLFLYFAYEACAGPLRAKLWPHWIYWLGLIAGLGATLAMVQIIPAYQLGVESIRSYVNYWEVSAGNDPRSLWTSFLPNFFGGINNAPLRVAYDLTYNYVFLTVPGVFLILCGMVATARRRDFFWIGAVLLFTELSLGNQGHLAGVVYATPVLNLFRVSAAYFEIANMAVCLLAAIGAESLLANDLSRRSQRVLAAILALLIIAGAAGAYGPLAVNLPSWRHALAALLVFSGIVLARFGNKLRTSHAQWAVVGLVFFDLWFYNSGQRFNGAPENPSTFMSADYAVGRKESLEFLRADPQADFRVAALAEYQWTGNGWNLWRIPGITGVNPVALRRYYDYMRVFSHVLNVRMATGGEDHNTNSPLADLLGVKYLLLANPEREAALGLGPGSKYSRVFDDSDWWRIYRNDQYFQRAWFYPKAYVLPREEEVISLLSSSWFDPRRILLLEQGAVPTEGKQRLEALSTLHIFPGNELQLTEGRQVSDPYCAQPIPMLGGWGGQGSEIRFTVPSSAPPGRYRILVRYTANELEMSSLGLDLLSREYPWYKTALPAMPRLEAVVESAAGSQTTLPASLPRTFGWPCHEARPADLGEVAFVAGQNRITIRSLEESALNVYNISLVRMPDGPAPQAQNFSFRNFSVSENRIAFDAEVGEDGFLLLNEIYYPGWEALVDGTPSRIYPADGAFRALYLAAGSHHIEFQFRPPYFYWGAAISMLTAILFLISLRVSLWRRRLTRPAD